MSLLFHGPHGSIEQRWIIYALLRDNVQHHLEGGRAGDEFRELHMMQLALGGRSISVRARELHVELEEAARALLDKPIRELAISGRTRAVISLSYPIPPVGETVLASDWDGQVEPAFDAITLGGVFGSLLIELLRITREATDEDRVVVTDM